MPSPKSLLAMLPCAALVLAGCWGGDSEPGGLVDTYAPKLTEAKGTVHSGDYFPLIPGEIASVRGTMTGTLQVSMRGVSGGAPVSMDTSDVLQDIMTGTVETQAARSMTFSQGTFTVYPQVSLTYASDDGIDQAEQTVLYFQKAADGVYVRGSLDPLDGNVVEPIRPLYFKLPLRVGDSWESASLDVPDVGDGELDMDMSVRSRTFVAGIEDVAVDGRNLRALRLDQVAEFSGTARDPEGMVMTLGGEMKVIVHLEEGRGQVRQQMSAKVSVKGSASQGSDRVTVTVTLDMRTDTEKVEVFQTADADGPRAKASAPAPAGTGPEASARVAALAAARAALRNLSSAR